MAGDVLKAKHWLYGEDEPETWNLETTDGDLSSESAGLAVYSAVGHIAYVRVEAVE